MNTEEFEDRLKALRPRLHRYCARMAGSAVDGEDVLQDTLVKALHALSEGAKVENLEGWLLRIAHNASLDFLRERSRNTVVPLSEDLEAAPMPEADIVAISFRTFLRLPELQRCAVILKDVLGHSVDEIATIAECSPAAAKSALQRGRVALRRTGAGVRRHAAAARVRFGPAEDRWLCSSVSERRFRRDPRHARR